MLCNCPSMHLHVMKNRGIQSATACILRDTIIMHDKAPYIETCMKSLFIHVGVV